MTKKSNRWHRWARWGMAMGVVAWVVGCEKVIDIDPSQSEPRVVVTAMVVGDSSLSVHLSYSRFFLSDEPFQPINNAQLSLWVGGTAASGDFSVSDGDYRHSHVARAGERLELRVVVPGHDEVSASTVVPAMPQVTRGRMHFTGDGMEGTVRLRLQDVAGEENYYSVKLRYEFDTLFRPMEDSLGALYYDTILGISEGYAWLESQDYLLFGGGNEMTEVLNQEGAARELYFTDHDIDGESHELAIDFSGIGGEAYWYEAEIGERLATRVSRPRLTLELTSYTRDLYLYMLSTRRAANDAVLDMFSEPVQIHSNIKGGGIGIFAARNTTKIVLTPDE